MAATWATADLGLLVGLLVAASTLGNASAFLLAAFGGVDWRSVMLGASALATMAALSIRLFRCGPRVQQATAFRVQYVLDAWRERPLRLANLGYYGHVWELHSCRPASRRRRLPSALQILANPQRVGPGSSSIRNGRCARDDGEHRSVDNTEVVGVSHLAFLIDHGVWIVLRASRNRAATPASIKDDAVQGQNASP